MGNKALSTTKQEQEDIKVHEVVENTPEQVHIDLSDEGLPSAEVVSNTIDEVAVDIIDVSSATSVTEVLPAEILSITEPITESTTEPMPEAPLISIDVLLREAGLLEQLKLDKEEKPGKTAYNRILKFLNYSGIDLCPSVNDIPQTLISLSPGAFTTYPTFLVSKKNTPSTVTISYPYSVLSTLSSSI